MCYNNCFHVNIMFVEPEDSILTATLKQFSSYLDDVSICLCNTYKSFVSRI
jgi:hypothetical protein